MKLIPLEQLDGNKPQVRNFAAVLILLDDPIFNNDTCPYIEQIQLFIKSTKNI